jgi:ATP-binding cassette subfamily B protein
MIPRLDEPPEGTIEIDHIDIRDWNVGQLRRQIGYVPQESLLFTGTVRENIAWGKEDASMEEIIEAAQAAQIHDTIKRLPNQYETMLGQRGVNLSGGQKQRLCIARALVRRPRILLLDDSTSALDLRTEARLMQALKRYECTTFLITQKLSTALNADKIVLLENGRISAVGKHDELWNHSELYRRIYQSQFGMEDVRHVQGMD